MAQFTFEGDLGNLAELQKSFIKSTLLTRGFNGGKVVVEPVGQKGDNYMAQVKRFIYEGNDGTTLKIIGKIAPVAEELRMMMKVKEMFDNELIIYEEILPKFNEIQKLANLTEDEKVRFPVCYGCLKEAPYELILLEDLNDSGFEMLDRFNPLSDDSVRLVLKDLARYHALSYALKHKEPVKFTTYANKLRHTWIEMGSHYDIFKSFEMAENDLLQMMQDADDKYKNMLKGTLSQIFEMFKKMKAYEAGSKYSVIQQGDCWSNNILFRLVFKIDQPSIITELYGVINDIVLQLHTELKVNVCNVEEERTDNMNRTVKADMICQTSEDGKPVQDIMIDYQLSRESIPVVDLLHLMLNCTDHATRLKHYQEWIDFYHDNLDEALNNYGLKANRIFPRDQLDAEIRRYGRLMITLSVTLSLILMRESNDAVDFKELAGSAKEMNLASMSIETFMKLKPRLIGIIDTAFEFGLV